MTMDAGDRGARRDCALRVGDVRLVGSRAGLTAWLSIDGSCRWRWLGWSRPGLLVAYSEGEEGAG
jgi:hypothetical protein